MRIAAIDTPEQGEPGYGEATDALRGMIESKTVRLRFTDPKSERDNWGRLLADVSVAGRDVGEALMTAGLAEQWSRQQR